MTWRPLIARCCNWTSCSCWSSSGEFNSGKSAFINALLGQRVLAEGVTPTTAQIHLLKYGEEAGQTAGGGRPAGRNVSGRVAARHQHRGHARHERRDPRHQEITEDFVPRADLVLFVTSADRPFSESERAFLERIREWGKKVVFVVNKIDILETPADIEHVIDFVESNSHEMLGRAPTVFPCPADRPGRPRRPSTPTNARASGPPAVSSRWSTTSSARWIERERLKLKLVSPLGVAQRLTERYLAVAEPRKGLLRDDVATVRAIDAELTAYETDMRRNFKYHLSHVDNVLYAMSERGNNFFDDTIRLQRVFDLVNTDKVRGMFEREVVADTAAQVEAHTHDLIDWLVQQDFHQWQPVMDYLNRRITLHEGRMVGKVDGKFEYNRQALLESVGYSAREVVATYDKEAESRALAESVQMAVAQTAIVEVGAMGLGALVIALARRPWPTSPASWRPAPLPPSGSTSCPTSAARPNATCRPRSPTCASA